MNIKKSFHIGLLLSGIMMSIPSHAMESGITNNMEIFNRLMSQQTTLTLNGCGLDDNAVCALASKISGTNFTSIDLGSNKFGHIGLKALIDVLPTTKINSLSIGYNRIDDNGISHLCASPYVSSYVNYIDVRGNPIGDASRTNLAKLIQTNSSKQINVSWNADSNILKDGLNIKAAASTNTPANESGNVQSQKIQDTYAGSAALILLFKSLCPAHGDKTYAEIAKRLITCRADVNYQEPNGYTALHWAAEKSHIDTKTIAVLCEAGADLTLCEKAHNFTPLDLACAYGRIEKINALLDYAEKKS